MIGLVLEDPPEGWEMPDTFGGAVEVIFPRLASKADARRVLLLCSEVEMAWKGYNTRAGFILHETHREARAILDGLKKPGPGRPGFHDWGQIDRLIDDVVAGMAEGRVTRAEVCRQVAARYGSISDTSSALRKRVTDRMREIGR